MSRLARQGIAGAPEEIKGHFGKVKLCGGCLTSSFMELKIPTGELLLPPYVRTSPERSEANLRLCKHLEFNRVR